MHLNDILKSFLPILVILVLPETSANFIKDQLDHYDQETANETKITQTENTTMYSVLRTVLPYHLMEYAVLISFIIATISLILGHSWIRKFRKVSELQEIIDKIEEKDIFDMSFPKNGLIMAYHSLLMLTLNNNLNNDWSKQQTAESEFLSSLK